MSDTKLFFNAKTFAVIGASKDPKKVGHTVFKNLINANKSAFPVNPNATSILNKKSYADIFCIPYKIDCIIIAVPAKLVPKILKQAGQKKIPSAIILSAGFSEIGNKELSNSIIKIAREEGIQILGPNSYGLLDPITNLNTTYYQGKLTPGKTAFISQSGAIGSAVLDSNQPLSGFVSVGNSAQLGFSDFIKYYNKDPNTKVITIYLESLKKERGQEFIKTCRACKKPIIVLKSGKSTAGQKAAQSHTASLASEAGVYEGILKQAKCIQVDSISQLFKTAGILEKYPNLKNSCTIITNAGGLGVLTTDGCESNNIKLTSLSKQTTLSLSKVLHPHWSHNNPIDIIGTALAQDYSNTIQILEKEKTDFLIVLLTPQKMTEALSTAKALLKTKKPVFACFLGNTNVNKAKQFMDQFGIINFNDPKEMCDTLGKLF